jgi:proline racemase
MIKTGEMFDHESITDTHFLSKVVETAKVGTIPPVTTTVSGRAWVTDITQCGMDPGDPFPCGYTLPDTWFA